MTMRYSLQQPFVLVLQFAIHTSVIFAGMMLTNTLLMAYLAIVTLDGTSDMLPSITSSIGPLQQLIFHLGWNHQVSDGKRPDGVTITPWTKGRILIWDATCIDTFAPSYVEEATREAGSVAAIAESRKRKKYEELSTIHEFTPVAIETILA